MEGGRGAQGLSGGGEGRTGTEWRGEAHRDYLEGGGVKGDSMTGFTGMVDGWMVVCVKGGYIRTVWV